VLIPNTIVQTSQAGEVLGYAENTTDVTISATASPGDLVVSLAPIQFDGSTVVMVEFFSARVETGATANSEVTGELFDSTTLVGRFFDINNVAAVVQRLPAYCSVRLTPTAGSHTYNVKAFRFTSNGVIRGAATRVPTFLRVVRV